MNAYNADHTHYFRIPSESILVTKGSQKYIQLYNAHGPYTKYRFQLCWENLAGGCRFKERCSFIHSVPGTSNYDVTDVHYNAEDATHATHPAGYALRVYVPNSQTTFEDIPSDMLYCTQGSVFALNNLHNPSARRAQHCAHFYLNHVCTRGSMCNFIHSMAKASLMQASRTHTTDSQTTLQKMEAGGVSSGSVGNVETA
jgi:hypothetical protein